MDMASRISTAHMILTEPTINAKKSTTFLTASRSIPAKSTAANQKSTLSASFVTFSENSSLLDALMSSIM
jgi:hypothetical protein